MHNVGLHLSYPFSRCFNVQDEEKEQKRKRDRARLARGEALDNDDDDTKPYGTDDEGMQARAGAFVFVERVCSRRYMIVLVHSACLRPSKPIVMTTSRVAQATREAGTCARCLGSTSSKVQSSCHTYHSCCCACCASVLAACSCCSSITLHNQIRVQRSACRCISRQSMACLHSMRHAVRNAARCSKRSTR